MVRARDRLERRAAEFADRVCHAVAMPLAASRRLTLRGAAEDNPTSDPAGKKMGDSRLDDKLNHMLRDLRRALSEAISESTEVSRTLKKIREEGYSLYLLVDCKRDVAEQEQLALPAGKVAAGEPSFQIDGRDLSFLKSIGIDPTRRLRRRRTESAHPSALR
jgi:hypothetical protein